MRTIALLALSLALAACSAAPEAAPTTAGWSELAAAPIEGRTAHGAVWTGRAMIVFGGEGREGPLGDGAAFDGASWTKLPAGPLSPRRSPAMVWTGREVLIHGGLDGRSEPLRDGAAYDPSTRTWTPLPESPLSARSLPAFAYAETTAELVVDGAAFSTRTRTWRVIAPSPLGARTHERAVWTGREVLFVGGLGVDGALSSEAATYDPARDAWTLVDAPLAARAAVTAVSTEHGAALIGGQTVAAEDGCPVALGDGATFDRATHTLQGIPNATVAARAEPAVWWGRGELFVLGGYRCDEILADGAAFDGTAWRALPRFPLSPRFGATAVWTGERAIVWGGAAADGARLNDGAALTP